MLLDVVMLGLTERSLISGHNSHTAIVLPFNIGLVLGALFPAEVIRVVEFDPMRTVA